MPDVPQLYDDYQSLTNRQKMIFDHIMANPEEICYISLKELSGRLGVAEVSVLRLCRQLGFSGYTDLKEAFRRYTQQVVRSVGTDDLALPGREADDSPDEHQRLQEVLASERQNLADLLDGCDMEQCFACARALLGAGQVVAMGHDASKIMADYLVHRLDYLQINANAYRLGETTPIQNALSRLEKDDVVVFFSFPPYHIPLYNIARYAEHRGATVVTVTDSLRSPAVTEHSLNFLCKTSVKYFFNSLTAPIAWTGIISTCIALSMGDKLDAILEEERSISRFLGGKAGELPTDGMP